MPTHAWSSTRRLAQLTGDYDPDPGGLPPGIDGVRRHVNFTGPWGVEGVDLGANTEHAGSLVVFFGDVPQPDGRPWPPRDADLVAFIRQPDVWPGALRLEPVARGGGFHPFTVRLNEPAAGDPATLGFGAQQHVFYRGRDGAINHNYWEPPNRLRHDQWSTRAAAPPSAGAPATMVAGAEQHVFYRGLDGHIEHLWCDAAAPDRMFHDQWTSRAGAPLAAGDPATMMTEGQQHVFYRGLDGHIEHLWWGAAAPNHVFHDQWTSRAGAPRAAGDPATMVIGTQQHVFYRGLDGHIEHLWWGATPAPNQVFHDQWTSRAGAPRAAGDPATMVTDGQQHVFYRGLDGHIEHLFWGPAAPNHILHDQWTSRAGAPRAAGDPATMVTAGQQHVFYRGLGGHIDHLLWDAAAPGEVFRDQWTSRAGAPLAAGDPATMVTAGQQHVFYRGLDGALDHVAWIEASAEFLHDQWTTLVPLSGETPTGAFSFNGRAFVFVWRGGASSLTSSPDPTAPAPFLWHFPLSRWGEDGHTAFLQVAPYVVATDELREQIPQIPQDQPVGLLMFGHGLGHDGWGVHLAWMPLRTDRDPVRDDVLYYQGPGRPWGPEQGRAHRLFATRFGWSSLSVGRLPEKGDWIVVSQRTGTVEDNRANGTWDEPIVARIAPTPWGIGDAVEVPIFSPVREGARGRYMAQLPDAPCQWPPAVHPSFAYGAYLLDYYTGWSARRRTATLVYLLSTGCPYQVQVMETQIMFT